MRGFLPAFANFRKSKNGSGLRCPRIAGLRVYPSAANFLLVELLDLPLHASRVYRELGRRGFLVRVCDSFHGMPKGRFLRLAVRTEEENNLLAQELSAICIALNRRAA